MPSKYHTASSCKYLLKLHLILVCKYRKQLLQGIIDEDMKQILFEISQISNFKIDVMESEKDHIHLLLDCEPTVSPSSIVNRLKAISTNRIWKRHFELLKTHFWKEQTF
jgi:putative transposase